MKKHCGYGNGENQQGALAELKRLVTEAHVWLSAPDVTTGQNRLAHCLFLLAANERERSQQFHFDKDRVHYLVAHALVRRVLSKYAGNDPADWRFSTNAHGRPEIESPNIVPNLRFNLTHTSGLCACVVTLDRDCGIDAEEISRTHNLQQIADRTFAVPELTAIGDLKDPSLRERFFRHWTMREAYCKALGVGLAGSNREFYFEVLDGGGPKLKFVHDSKNSEQWQLTLLRPTDSHVVAVAIHRPHAPDLRVVVRTMEACI